MFRQRSDFNSINESTRGDFSFNRLLTANADIPGTGMGMASFLLGTPSAFVRGKINFIATDRVWRMGFYFRDAWRVTPKLTVNYGIRWDFIGRPHPRNPAENSNYDPETNNLLLACVGQVSCTSNVDNDLNDFGARLGIAYKLFSSTVIRAGYGRSYFASNFGGHLGTLGVNFPMQVRQNITQTNQFFAFPNPENGAPFTLDQAVPAAPSVQIPESGLLPLPPGLNVWSVPRDSETSELDSWNLTLQHQLSQNLSVSAGYVGSAARNLYDNLDINAPFPEQAPSILAGDTSISLAMPAPSICAVVAPHQTTIPCWYRSRSDLREAIRSFPITPGRKPSTSSLEALAGLVSQTIPLTAGPVGESQNTTEPVR